MAAPCPQTLCPAPAGPAHALQQMAFHRAAQEQDGADCHSGAGCHPGYPVVQKSIAPGLQSRHRHARRLCLRGRNSCLR